ncbi:MULTISPECIES: HAD family hydrolase [Streptomyces violaceusniger group]|uniref:HAD family hydrolase n=1 Tax=Streptomyces antimycoticus TaxID=68175 RepID=A0ABD5J481_9ACTN|nr:HAD family hydrolase [Streptomyces violaceusniger]MEE4583147.1 HAD family hydrolase [Streptomyces sp. DSM 41602]
MSVSPEPQPRLLPPRLLALDMGGVIVEALPAPGWAARFATRLLGHARHCLPPGTDLPTIEQVATDLADGRARHDSWKDGTVGGAELSRSELWAGLSRPTWGRPLLDHIIRNRADLTAELCLVWEEREVRDGIRELLVECTRAGIAVGVVSNTISGPAYRSVLDQAGLTGYFRALSFSDEVGIRKPDPRLLLDAIGVAGVTPGTTWYVGDTYRRDVVCGRRARAGTTILMRSRRTESASDGGPEPDHTVSDPAGLHALLRAALRTPTTSRGGGLHTTR